MLYVSEADLPEAKVVSFGNELRTVLGNVISVRPEQVRMVLTRLDRAQTMDALQGVLDAEMKHE